MDNHKVDNHKVSKEKVNEDKMERIKGVEKTPLDLARVSSELRSGDRKFWSTIALFQSRNEQRYRARIMPEGLISHIELLL